MSGQGEAGVGGRRESRRTRRKREGWIRGGGRGQRGGFIRGDSPLFSARYMIWRKNMRFGARRPGLHCLLALCHRHVSQ